MEESKALVTIDQNVPLADSRIIAEKLGITHKSMMQLIRDYLPEIEEDFGKVRFENAVKSGNRGGAQPKYAMLTEHQAYAYMTYSQNTDQARACKRSLVKGFMEAKQLIEKYKQLIAIHEAEKAKMIPNAKVDELEVLLIRFQQLAQQKRLPGPELLEEAILFMRQHHHTITAFDQKLIKLYNAQ